MIEQQGYSDGLIITGGNYPPTATQTMIAQITQGLWFAGLALTFGGAQIFNALGVKPPALYEQAQQNKMMVLGSLWFVNNFGNSQLSTGAFEMYLDDELIFSKMNSKGTVPSGEDILRIMKEAGFK